MSAPSSPAKTTAQKNVFRAALIAGLAGLLFGYDTGVIAGALLFIRQSFDLNSLEQGLVVSAVPIGAALAALFARRISDHWGRKRAILVAAALFIIGSIISAIAPGPEVLIGARFVIGLAIGLASATAPVYVSEIAPADKRGSLVTLFQLSVTIGILVAYFVGLAFNSSGDWRMMLAVGVVPALLLAIGVMRTPQSPRWLVLVNRDEQAKQVLQTIRDGDVDDEVQEIKQGLQESKGDKSLLHSPAVKAAMFVGVGLAILQQVTGINTVIYYAPTIFQYTGIDSTSSAIWASVGVGIVNVGATILAFKILDKVGRRTLLLIGVSGMTLSLFALGGAFAGENETTLAAVIAIISLMTYIASFAISLGAVFWLLNAEIYPLAVRTQAAGIGTFFNWFFNFLVSLTFLLLIGALGQSGTFWLYGAIGAFTIFFVYKWVPETKGKSLEEIQELFAKRAGE